MAEPWFKFYPTDWRADPALKMCSLAARGLWIEMLGFMHDAAQYGHLLVANRPPTDAQLAVLIGSTPAQISELLGELEAAAVFSRTRKGVIYSRKMVRDAKKAETARKNGKKGGNPSLSNKRINPSSDNQPDKGEDKPQKPEARSQIEDDGGGCGSARATEADPDGSTLRERVLSAMGVGPDGVIGPSKFIGSPADMAETKRWLAMPGITIDAIEAEISGVMRGKRDGPPARFSYFTPAMQRLSAALTAPPLAPIEGSSHEQARPNFSDRRAAAADDALRQRIEGAARNRSPSKGGIRFG